MNRLRCSSDRGSVMMLMVGLIPILFMMVAVSTDAAVLFNHRRSLAAEADAAVVAGAQSADLAAVYSGKQSINLPLDCAKAREVIKSRVGSMSSDKRASAARVATIDCTPAQVSVSISTPVELPFSHYFGLRPTVDVKATSAARSRLR